VWRFLFWKEKKKKDLKSKVQFEELNVPRSSSWSVEILLEAIKKIYIYFFQFSIICICILFYFNYFFIHPSHFKACLRGKGYMTATNNQAVNNFVDNFMTIKNATEPNYAICLKFQCQTCRTHPIPCSPVYNGLL
jgi:hypothetical protein